MEVIHLEESIVRSRTGCLVVRGWTHSRMRWCFLRLIRLLNIWSRHRLGCLGTVAIPPSTKVFVFDSGSTELPCRPRPMDNHSIGPSDGNNCNAEIQRDSDYQKAHSHT